ncbi:ABC transporter ATP-binding protein [Lolliginicoccus suaedae]|uniref:ABC transporter ATP-binding protein n=1 Tax=Lolliginicoccus suaedae TaxID=2605429 RepID=UPI0011EF985F|nr:ABC transporter ATP-binding protein [Lolliginicoccus suaedae]
MTHSPVLSGRGLTKRYGPHTVLHDASIDVEPQGTLAIMGPSGSGKSTLLHLLSGIVQPDAGEVLLEGTDISALRESARTALRRRAFGFVFQSGQLLPELPAIENVALPLILDGMSVRAARDRAATLFDPLGIAGLEERRPGEMSGGQAQRVAIARAMVARPTVLFADEPTGALDARTSQDVMGILVEASRHLGTALVVVTHDPQVAGYCQRVVHMHDGRLAQRSAS